MMCILCHEQVTNPLCPECLGEAIEQWLWESAPERIEGLHNETDTLRHPHGVRCVRCHARFDVCTYCYTKQIFNWLKGSKLQLEFLEFFNFDMYRLTPYGGQRVLSSAEH
jgi:hypothetical protein